MRSTIHLGLICLTIAFICFLKYFAGPVAIVKEQQDFIITMTHGGRAISPKAPVTKLSYVSPIWQPYPPRRQLSPDPDSPPIEDR